ncbi:unnamed protein product [Scytosiphon promiscuus]
MSANASAVAAAPTSRAPGQKKSCDLCVFRKRKCDGAMPTCGFCRSRGSECHYSFRRPNRPRGYARDAAVERGGQPRLEEGGKTGSGYGSGEEESCETEQRQPEPPPIGWKRIRLSPSPATGLVGTKENAFLGSFFSCLGFLPLTHERLIRGTMMDILLASPSGPEGIDQLSVEGQNVGKIPKLEEASPAGDQEQSGGDAASACALWCTIAMGALVQGQPPGQIAPYMHLAWTSLSQCFDTVSVESGRAFLMMAYLYNFMRDDHKFCRYLEIARRVVNRLPENTVQKQEIDELVMMGDDTRIFHTAALGPSELDAYCTDNSPALEVPDVVHKSDLCRLLLQADRRMMKAFLRDHRAHEYHKLEKVSREEIYAEGGVEGYLSGISVKMDGVTIDSTKIDEETSPSRPGDETWKCTEEARTIFARLGEAAEAPEIRAGVGSLLYNSILGYLDMITGSAEFEAGYDKVKHCAEIISRYPGLCRFSTWRHLSHCLLSFLSKLGDVGRFEDLRQAYNSVRAEDAPEVPPQSEWTMVGFCDHIFCRSMDRLERNWGGLTAPGKPTAGESEEQRWLSNEPHWLHDTQENNHHWASLAPEIHSSTAVPSQLFPTHEWTDVMPPGLVDAKSIAAHRSPQLVPPPAFPSAGPHPSSYVNQAWWMAGRTQAMPPDDWVYDGGYAPPGARGGGHPHHGWYSSAPAAAANAPTAYYGATAMWRQSSSMSAAGSDQMTASSARQAFGEKVVHSSDGSGEREFRGMSGSSTSDTSGAEGGYDGSAERTADRFRWWVDAASSHNTQDRQSR